MCPRCEKMAHNLFWEIAQHHSNGEAARIFSRIVADDVGFGTPSTRQDLIHHDNARLLTDFDAAYKVNPNVADS